MTDGSIDVDTLMVSTTTNDSDKGSAFGSWRRRFSVNVAFTIVTRAINLASGLATSVIVARWLGARGIGALAVINVSVALAVQLGGAGLLSANTYFIAQDRRKISRISSNALLVGIFLGSLMALVLLLTAWFRPLLFGQVPLSLITLAAVSIPFQLITLLGLNIYLGIDRIDRFNLIETLSQILLLLNAALTVAWGFGLLGLFSLNTISAVIVSLLLVFSIHRVIKSMGLPSLLPDLKLLKQMARYGIKFHVSAVAGIVIMRADLLLVNHFRGAQEAGVYAVATQMGNLLLFLPSIVATLLFPRVASELDSKAALTMRVTRHSAFIMLIVCLAAIPFSFAIPLIYGSAFTGSTKLLLILIPGVYLLGIEAVMVQHFNGLGLPITIPVFWMIAVVTNLGLNLVLIPRLGALGAALVSTMTYALVFALVSVYFCVKTGNKLSSALLLQSREFRALFRADRFTVFSRN